MSSEKFGKPSVAVIDNKKSFFENNQYHLNDIKRVNDVLKKQQKRNGCKICLKDDSKEIIVHEIKYYWCNNCKHLTGEFDDSDEYANSLYINSDGQNYSDNYKNDYIKRVQDIYIPKAEFLIEFMNNIDRRKFTVTDLGCGAGHFVMALDMLGIDAKGMDVSKDLISLGNTMIGMPRLSQLDFKEIYSQILENRSDVLSLIGVLEHLQDPLCAVEAFKKSTCDYMYLQVPLFSLSVLLEASNPDVFPRQLNKGHTHLFTKESLEWIFAKYDLKVKAEWWFGTDFVDLYRHLLVKISQTNKSIYQEIFDAMLVNHIDDLQLVLDKSKRASGVNMIIGKH